MKKLELSDNYKVVIACLKCGAEHVFDVTKEQKKELDSGEKLIQDILPNLKPAEREMFISGTCGDCWNEIFSNNDRRSGDR